MKRLCGANIWADWGIKTGELKDKLFIYAGTASIKGVACYQFIPYKRAGYPVIYDMETLMQNYCKFKPFIIDSYSFFNLTDNGNSIA